MDIIILKDGAIIARVEEKKTQVFSDGIEEVVTSKTLEINSKSIELVNLSSKDLEGSYEAIGIEYDFAMMDMVKVLNSGIYSNRVFDILSSYWRISHVKTWTLVIGTLLLGVEVVEGGTTIVDSNRFDSIKELMDTLPNASIRNHMTYTINNI